jgi:hypothetical protein
VLAANEPIRRSPVTGLPDQQPWYTCRPVGPTCRDLLGLEKRAQWRKASGISYDMIKVNNLR